MPLWPLSDYEYHPTYMLGINILYAHLKINVASNTSKEINSIKLVKNDIWNSQDNGYQNTKNLIISPSFMEYLNIRIIE